MAGRLLDPSSHPKSEIRVILIRLKRDGWTIRVAAHWGTLYCPCQSHCTRIPVPGTPQNAGRAARRIANEARRCPLPPDDPRHWARHVGF
jgi:hypothetical protein